MSSVGPQVPTINKTKIMYFCCLPITIGELDKWTLISNQATFPTYEAVLDVGSSHFRKLSPDEIGLDTIGTALAVPTKEIGGQGLDTIDTSQAVPT